MVALQALDLLMFAQQGKLRTTMVEVAVFPVLFAVASGAVLFELTLVIIGVAVHAVGKSQIAKLSLAVARFALYRLMFADQGKTRCAVVKATARLVPVVYYVTALASGAEARVMWVGVAIDTMGKG